MSSIRRILLTVGAVLAALLPLTTVAAQGSEGGSGLQISPIRHRLTMNPGESKTILIIVKNVTQGSLVAKVGLNDFESDGESGEPKILIDPKERTPNSLEKFITGFQDISLKSGESKEAKLFLNAPANTPAGAYYGAVRFTAIPAGANDDDRRVTLNASVASLVLVEVAGDITESIQLLSVKATKGKNAGSFFFSVPDQSAVTVKNTGNGFSQPFGRVSVTGMNNKEVYSYELNNKDPRGNILPDSTRVFRDELKNIKNPGRYKVTANISHGSGGQVLTVQSTFWYVPVWLLVTILVIIVGLVVLAYVFYRTRLNRQLRHHRR